ncbi:serpin family protein [Erythrobacter sp.]|jgi:serpin B|uniref:serpin family protein n=1 Tax=Erythrobacter sp. TaxID=1042 RepID=UPI002EBE1D9F|nr:serpin family protein [Erythrobacter sp.]
MLAWITRTIALAACLGFAGCSIPGEDRSTSEPVLLVANSAGAAALFPILDAEARPADNVFFSPLSIDHAFGIVALGARGETAAQLAQVLPPPERPRAYTHSGEGVELRLANKLWVDQQFSLSNAFETAARGRYASAIDAIDKTDPPGSSRVINAWASEATDGLIPEVVSPDEITDDLALFVTNAILFDGDWAQVFEDVQEKPFLFGSGADEPFLFMQERLTVSTVDRGEWRAVRLPYRDDRYAMDIIMPAKREVMRSTPALSEIAQLGNALDVAEPELVDMELPRFEIDTDMNLIPPLQALGLTLPFDRDNADLSGIGESGARNLYVGDAKQLAKLQVFDTGTRAAAVTVVTIRLSSAPPPDRRLAVSFLVDRPFLVALRDLETGTMLFLGRIADPQPYTPEEVEPPN